MSKEIEELKGRVQQLQDCVVENTRAIGDLTRLIEEQTRSTAGVVAAFDNMVTLAKLGSKTHRFLWTVAKLPLMGAGLYQIGSWLIEKTPGL